MEGGAKAPQMGTPPKMSTEAQKDLDNLANPAPLSDTPFSENQWIIIARNGDKLINSVGNMSDAAHCYVAKRREIRQPTTLTPQD